MKEWAAAFWHPGWLTVVALRGGNWSALIIRLTPLLMLSGWASKLVLCVPTPTAPLHLAKGATHLRSWRGTCAMSCQGIVVRYKMIQVWSWSLCFDLFCKEITFRLVWSQTTCPNQWEPYSVPSHTAPPCFKIIRPLDELGCSNYMRLHHYKPYTMYIYIYINGTTWTAPIKQITLSR